MNHSTRGRNTSKVERPRLLQKDVFNTRSTQTATRLTRIQLDLAIDSITSILYDKLLPRSIQQNLDSDYKEKRWRKEREKKRGGLSQTLPYNKPLHWIQTTLDILHPLTLINTHAEIHICYSYMKISHQLPSHRRSQKNHFFKSSKHTTIHSDHSLHGS